MAIASLRGMIGVFGLLTLVGCGWKSDGIARLTQLYPPVDAGSAGFTSAGSSCSSDADGGTADAGPLDLTNPTGSGYQGTWAVRLLENGTISPLDPTMPWDISITDLFLASSDGQTVTMNSCSDQVLLSLQGVPESLGQTKVPCSLQTALGQTPVTFQLPSEGWSAGTVSNVVWLWGMQKVADPVTDTLPTDPTNPHVWDQDVDGNPGVTLTLFSPPNELYLTRRAVWQLESGKPSIDFLWITGKLQFTVEESLLGASNPSSPHPLSPITQNPTGSVFQMRRVPSSFTCNALIQHQDEIFKDAPSQ